MRTIGYDHRVVLNLGAKSMYFLKMISKILIKTELRYPRIEIEKRHLGMHYYRRLLVNL